MRKSKSVIVLCVSVGLCLVMGLAGPAQGRGETTPLRFLKEQEQKHREVKGETYLGKVVVLTYPAYAVEPDRRYHPFLLELTDVIKTPLRKNYRLVLKGYSDNSGTAGANLGLSLKRAETLKKTLIEQYFMDGRRITTEGYGEADPVASNESAEGRALNRRVEIHVRGDVSEAVRFLQKEEEVK
jgi:hypothetical protein